MVGLTASLPVKWEQFLKRLADDHGIDLNTVVSELCEWAFPILKAKSSLKFGWMRLIPQKERLKTKQELQEKKLPRKKKSAEKNLKRNPTNTEIEITAHAVSSYRAKVVMI